MMLTLTRVLVFVLALLATPMIAAAQQTMNSTGPCPTAGLVLYPGQLCVRLDLTPNQLYVYDGAARQWDAVITFATLSGASNGATLNPFSVNASTGAIGQQYLGVGMTSAPNTGIGQADLVFQMKPANSQPIPVALGHVAFEVVQSGNTCQLFAVTANGRQFFGQGFKC